MVCVRDGYSRNKILRYIKLGGQLFRSRKGNTTYCCEFAAADLKRSTATYSLERYSLRIALAKSLKRQLFSFYIEYNCHALLQLQYARKI